MNNSTFKCSFFSGYFPGKLPLILLFIVTGYSGIFAQNSKKTNLEIFEQEISGEFDKILYYPAVSRNLKFVFFVSSLNNGKNFNTNTANSKEEKKFIEGIIKKSAETNNLNISFSKDENMESPDSVYNKCRIIINKLNTDYTKMVKNGFLGKKTMQRVITSRLDLKLSLNTGALLVNELINTEYEDEIPYDDYTVLQATQYSFTQSVPPDISFIESIIFPAAVITVSAVAAILFFSIRSK